jgi:hypothetical protein
MKVLYILGTQRGGTTIVGRILGLIPGVAYAGEVRRFWEFGVAPERRCGCGQPLAACPVWSVVLDRVRAAGITPSDVPAWQREVAPARSSWRSTRAIGRGIDGGGNASGALPGYLRALSATYAGLAEAYGAEVLVDNSKLPFDGALLRHVSGVSAYFLHVVRDPRGVLSSRLRRQHRTSPVKRSADTAVLAAAWVARHVRSGQVTSAVDPNCCVRMRYEDFVADPSAAVAIVGDLLGLPVPPKVGPTFELPIVHTPKGPNPATATVLVQDVRWRQELGALERGLVTTLTAPWLLRDGYFRRSDAPGEAWADRNQD